MAGWPAATAGSPSSLWKMMVCTVRIQAAAQVAGITGRVAWPHRRGERDQAVFVHGQHGHPGHHFLEPAAGLRPEATPKETARGSAATAAGKPPKTSARSVPGRSSRQETFWHPGIRPPPRIPGRGFAASRACSGFYGIRSGATVPGRLPAHDPGRRDHLGIRSVFNPARNRPPHRCTRLRLIAPVEGYGR